MLKISNQGAEPVHHHPKTHKERSPVKTEVVLFNWKNFKKSPITSLIGLVIIVSSVYTVVRKETGTWGDAVIGLGIGILLLLAPDKLVNSIKSIFTSRTY